MRRPRGKFSNGRFYSFPATEIRIRCSGNLHSIKTTAGGAVVCVECDRELTRLRTTLSGVKETNCHRIRRRLTAAIWERHQHHDFANVVREVRRARGRRARSSPFPAPPLKIQIAKRILAMFDVLGPRYATSWDNASWDLAEQTFSHALHVLGHQHIWQRGYLVIGLDFGEMLITLAQPGVHARIRLRLHPSGQLKDGAGRVKLILPLATMQRINDARKAYQAQQAVVVPLPPGHDNGSPAGGHAQDLAHAVGAVSLSQPPPRDGTGGGDGSTGSANAVPMPVCHEEVVSWRAGSEGLLGRLLRQTDAGEAQAANVLPQYQSPLPLTPDETD